MSETLIIGSFNFQNKKANRKGIKINGVDPASLIAEHIHRFGYDVLGTQEITRRFRFRLNKYLKGYETTGKYRYLNNVFSKWIPSVIDYNESTTIITKRKVFKSATKHLPSFPGIPRIATIAILEDENGQLCMINTHLDRKNVKIQTKQLAFLKKLVEMYQTFGSVVLLGDFNATMNHPHFQEFRQQLEALGLKRVEINEKTQIKRKRAIDHIFIPTSWKVLDKGCVNDNKLKEVTDHTGVFVKVAKFS